MSKLNWNKAAKKDLIKNRGYEIVESEYQQKVNNKKDFPDYYIDLGIHKKHKRKILNGPFGPHARQLICLTCKNKWLAWLPKE